MAEFNIIHPSLDFMAFYMYAFESKIKHSNDEYEEIKIAVFFNHASQSEYMNKKSEEYKKSGYLKEHYKIANESPSLN